MTRVLLKLSRRFGLIGVAIACLLNSCPASAQRIPSCSDENTKQKMTDLLGRWLQNQLNVGWNTEVQAGVAPPGASKPTVQNVIILSSTQNTFIGYTPCMISGQAITFNNQKRAITNFQLIIIKVAYDNDGALVMEMLDGFR